MAAVARHLGTPLTPMQRHVADVAEERRPDGSYEYQVIVWTVPRQTGKTTLLRALGVKRALQARDVFYTAQTGKDARARWMDLVKIIRTTKGLRDRTTVALRGGSEHVTFPGGGVFQCFAPTPESLHGYTPPTVLLDESFAHTAAVGELLMGAIEPAQQTVVDKQLWIVSTMGTAESVFLHDWIERARDGVPRVALLDWGAGDHHDPFNLEHIAEFHPGVGQRLNGKVMTAADILAASDKMSRAEYLRAYANRRTATTAALIGESAWADLQVPADLFQFAGDTSAVTLAYDVDEHGSRAAIVAVWEDPTTGKPAAKVVRAEPGTAWLHGAVVDLDRSWRPRSVVAVGSGPALQHTLRLQDDHVTVRELAEREWSAASGGLLTAVRDGGLIVSRDDAELADSATGLGGRTSRDGGTVLSRTLSAGSSAAGFALAAAVHQHARTPVGAAPVVRFG